MSRHCFALFFALLLFPVSPATQSSPSSTDTVILITLDGARTEEVFGGLDVDILRSTLAKEAKLEAQPAYKRFHADTPEARREKLMPFFWRELMAQPRVDRRQRPTEELRHADQHPSVLLPGLLGDPAGRSARRRHQEQRPGAESVS